MKVKASSRMRRAEHAARMGEFETTAQILENLGGGGRLLVQLPVERRIILI
jgi:hypothetical protein